MRAIHCSVSRGGSSCSHACSIGSPISVTPGDLDCHPPPYPSRLPSSFNRVPSWSWNLRRLLDPSHSPHTHPHQTAPSRMGRAYSQGQRKPAGLQGQGSSGPAQALASDLPWLLQIQTAPSPWAKSLPGNFDKQL